MEKPDLKTLESQLDALIHRCSQLMDENRFLRDQQVVLLSERDTLLEKNALACTRIEAMIARLKSMEVDNNNI